MNPKTVPAIVIAMLVLAPFLSRADEAEQRQPNFLLVVADDMGWTDIGSFGSEIETPNLVALAQRGVMFTDFHVSVSCSPTRSMLLSGADNHTAGLGNMGEMLAPNQKGETGLRGLPQQPRRLPRGSAPRWRVSHLYGGQMAPGARARTVPPRSRIRAIVQHALWWGQLLE